jgi:hypothetical protein
MKSTKQIQDRITHLESRMKDGLDVVWTIKLLTHLINKSEVELRDILISATSQGGYIYMREVLWVIED